MREDVDEDDTGEQDPLHQVVGKGHDRYEGGPHLERKVALGMLQDMAALMGGDGRGRDAAAGIDFAAEVDGLGLGVVMVGQAAFDAGDLDIVDAVFTQHLLGDLGAGQAGRQGYLGVFRKPALQGLLDDETGHHHSDHDNPNVHANQFLSGSVQNARRLQK